MKYKNRRSIMVIFIVLMGLGLYLGVKKGDDKTERILSGIMGLIIGGMVALFVMFAVVSMSPSEQKYEELDRVELVALNNSRSTEGAFFLGSGRIESIPYYFFYYQLPDGGKKLGKLIAENATVYEEKRTNAYMARVSGKTIRKKTRILSWLLIPESLLHGTRSSSYALHVPEGTIVKGITLDLKEIK
ncbi:MAG: hypothetical protein V1804_02070 [Patescibacteria group bacterium]